MNPIERVVRSVDEAQQRNGPAGFVFSVFKKFADDRGPQLAALLAYYGFLSLFPALLIVTTVVGFVGNERVVGTVVGSILGGLPVFGEQIGDDATQPLEGSVVGLSLGVLFLLYGALGVAQAGQHAMAQVWNVPGVVRPGFFPRLVRSMAFALLMAAGIAVVTAVSTAGTLGDAGVVWRVLSFLIQTVLTAGLYLAVFRVLTPKSILTSCLVPGACVGGVGYSLLLLAGAALVEHQLDQSQQLYGQFALVLGLLGWLYLVATVSLYAAEVNVVIQRRLWPRSIVQPPLTEADEKVLADIARQEERRPEQQVVVDFETPVS
jgi:YihY family inner membrane protein